MDLAELQEIVDAITENRRLGDLKPHELLKSIHRKRFPADALPIIERLLHLDSTYKYAIEMIGKLKGASHEASDAVEAAWERSWEFGVPQACGETFRALVRIGENDDRLLAMINRAMEVDNYGVHGLCAEALMKINGGEELLRNWRETIAGQCECHLHKKLATKVAQHVEST